MSGALLALGAGLLLAGPSPLLPLSSPALPAGLLAPFSGLQHPVFASLLIGSFPSHKARGEHLEPQHPVTVGLAGRVREGTRQLGSPENFLKLDRVEAHNVNPFPTRPLFVPTQADLGFFHLTQQGTANVFKDHFLGSAFWTPSCKGRHYKAQCNVVLKLFHS